MQDRLAALPAVVDQAGYNDYVKTWSELVGLTSEVDWRHHALMRKQVRSSRTWDVRTTPPPLPT